MGVPMEFNKKETLQEIQDTLINMLADVIMADKCESVIDITSHKEKLKNVNIALNRLENIYGKGIDNVYPKGLQK